MLCPASVGVRVKESGVSKVTDQEVTASHSCVGLLLTGKYSILNPEATVNKPPGTRAEK